MGSGDLHNVQMLRDARRRAQKVVDELHRQKDDLRRAPATMDGKKIEAGKLAVGRALESARRMLAEIDDAIRAAAETSNQESAT